MEEQEFRAVIKHFSMKGWTPKMIMEELVSVHGTCAPSYTTVKKWAANFKMGQTSTSDDPRSGRPISATTEENEHKVLALVMEDRRITVREIAEAIGISKDSVGKILHEHLAMQKVSARWVPRLLSADQKFQRLQSSQQCLALLQRNPTDFLRRFVTVDETWIHHRTPESKQQSMQWIAKGERAPKKAKTVPSAGKVMATIFWDRKGLLLHDFLEHGKTINGEYYATLLDRLNESIKKTRPGLQKKTVLFHQDNAPPHISAVAMAKLHDLGYELIVHPPYSPDLAPCDFYLFPQLKKHLAGIKFQSDSEAIGAVKAFFESCDTSFFSEGIEKLKHRWTKCVELQGDYIEK